MPAEKGRNAALTQEPDPDNAGVGPPQKDPSRHGAGGAIFVASSPTNRRNEGMRNRKLQMLCEGAILVALAQILSMLKLWEMPWGGSITLGMLPIFLFAVRWGTRWGLVAGFAYGLLQVMFDGGFAISWQSILGDYLVAFTVLGLAGLGRGREKGIFLGTVLGGAARFVVHWVVGATVWAMYMPDAFFGMTMTSPWLYSLLYNGFYMLIDTLLCLVIFALLFRPMHQYLTGADLRKTTD